MLRATVVGAISLCSSPDVDQLVCALPPMLISVFVARNICEHRGGCIALRRRGSLLSYKTRGVANFAMRVEPSRAGGDGVNRRGSLRSLARHVVAFRESNAIVDGALLAAWRQEAGRQPARLIPLVGHNRAVSHIG
jgi:hypothetical protein